MRKLKGIMINGEWLGERVVINGLFRAICSISPVIMLEFVKLINKLEYKNKVFTITGFEFPTPDTIHINFEDREHRGYADLCFTIENLDLKLKNSFLDIKPLTSAVANDNNSEAENPESEAICETQEPEEKKERPAAEEEKIDINIAEKLNSDTKTEVIEETIEEPEVCNDIVNEDILIEEEKPTVLEKEEHSKEKEIQEAGIYKEFELKNSEPATAVNTEPQRPIIIEVVQQAPQQPSVQPVIQPAAQPVVQSIIQPEQQTIQVQTPAEREIAEEISHLKPVLKKVEEAEEFIPEPTAISAEKQEPKLFFEQQEEKSVKFDFEEEKDENDIFLQLKSLKEESSETEKTEETLKEPVTVQEEIIDNTGAEECLAEFYSSFVQETESVKVEEEDVKPEISNQTEFIMQAVIAEMAALKEEIEVLKNEPQKKITAGEFFGENEQKPFIKDEDADFKIMGSESRINAAILDEDCFIAGEKLYRWGETLYLEE